MNKCTIFKTVTLTVISLAAQSSAFAVQLCNSQIQKTAADSAFEVHGDGTVTQTSTGLMWSTCLVGQSYQTDGTCTGTAFAETWESALLIATDESVGGYSDWRLPNVNELVSILELQCESPALNTTVFPGMDGVSILWTSTPASINGVGNTVMIEFGVPGPDSLLTEYPFLLVRGE